MVRVIVSLWVGIALLLLGKVESALPAELDRFIQKQHVLPHYVEAGYSPLGRSPVVDAVLGDPFYLPTYANRVAQLLKENSEHNSLERLTTTVLRAGGIPAVELKFTSIPENIPSPFTTVFGKEVGTHLYTQWAQFKEIYKTIEQVLAVLTEEEKTYLRANADAFFFGCNPTSEEYDFFTTESGFPLKFYEMASRIDLAKLAACAQQLTIVVDAIYQHSFAWAAVYLKDDFVWEEEGIRLRVTAKERTTLTNQADFFIDLGGNNHVFNNAGGTRGLRAAALHIDFMGDNVYEGGNFVQGAGFLGVGILASFSGNNTYKAKAYSQGCGFFGVGLLMNLGKENQFEIDFGGQSFALFGCSLLWTKGGKTTYTALQGMAQAASSTLGIAFLVDNEGNNSYCSGVIGKGGKRSGGIGQGGSTGVRYDPWRGHPSFYGGIAFLYNGGDNNHFRTAWLGQGSAYFLSTGILVTEGLHDDFYADFDSQGQGLHLSSGLLLKKGGGDNFYGGWGSLGVGADRSVGMLIHLGGNNFYQGTQESIGTARKPKALGVFIEMQGNNSYVFQKTSPASVQKPETPNEWPTALFLQIGKNNQYSDNADGAGSGQRWGLKPQGIGIDTGKEQEADLFAKFPQRPRIPFSFDPEKGWSANTAFRPNPRATRPAELQKMIEEIKTAPYERRRQLYEQIDLTRFFYPNFVIDLSPLLANPEDLSEDQFNYAVLWSTQNNSTAHVEDVLRALEQGKIASPYSRKMGIALLGKFWLPQAEPVFEQIMLNDNIPAVQYQAAFVLSQHANEKTFPILKKGLENGSERVRYAIAKGLQDNSTPETLDLITPLFSDPSFYVRRAAGLTAISLHDKAGIPVLLDTLQYETLDTTDNYGKNIFNELARYVGVNFKLDKEAWKNWWEEVHDHFEFPLEVCPAPV